MVWITCSLHGGIQVVQLRGIVPGKTCAIVAVIDIAGLATRAIAAAEDNSRVGLFKIVIFNLDFHSAIAR
jgi:hypothetical protein